MLVEFPINSSRCELVVSMVVTSCTVPPLVLRPVPACNMFICCVFDILLVVDIPLVVYAGIFVETTIPLLDEGEDAEFGRSDPPFPLTLRPTLPQVEATDGGEQVFVSITQLAYLFVGLALRLAKLARSLDLRYCNCSSWL